MKRLIVGNWKMNLNTKQSETLIERLVIHTPKPTAEIVVCPNFVAISVINQKIDALDANIKLGSQNINDNDEGAFTGEVSGPMLKGQVKYSIVGHSERRIIFGETDELISRKVSACTRNKIIPILCIGENLKERQDGLASRKVIDQLDIGLSELTKDEISKVTIAYEPVWAISTSGVGEIAKPYEVEKMILEIYKFLVNRHGLEIAEKTRIIYGGSVNSDNISGYLAISKISGALVGGASLNYREFSKICQL